MPKEECSQVESQTLLKRAQLWLTGWQSRLWDTTLVELAGNLLSKVSGKADPREIFHQRYSATKPTEVGKCQGS